VYHEWVLRIRHRFIDKSDNVMSAKGVEILTSTVLYQMISEGLHLQVQKISSRCGKHTPIDSITNYSLYFFSEL